MSTYRCYPCMEIFSHLIVLPLKKSGRVFKLIIAVPVIILWFVISIRLLNSAPADGPSDDVPFDKVPPPVVRSSVDPSLYVEILLNSPHDTKFGHSSDLNQVHKLGENVVYHPKKSKKAKSNITGRGILLRRRLRDVRHPACRAIRYEDLPSASIIIAYYNERWPTLVRTVNSIIDRTPGHLLKEILIVDDFSEILEDYKKQKLHEHLAKMSKVRFMRTNSRMGFSGARLLGASIASGDILVFMDSHTECSKGWLEPLLFNVKNSKSGLFVPITDTIDVSSLVYEPIRDSDLSVGTFGWDLKIQSILVSLRNIGTRTEPDSIKNIRSPVLLGEIFAISHEFFNLINGYSANIRESMEANLEMSLKVWMCGGSIELAPCSHVGHLNRYEPTNFERKDLDRIAEVWLDDHKNKYLKKGGNAIVDSKEVQNQKNMKKKLKCHNFNWYLKNILPELFVPELALAYGLIQCKEERSFPVCIEKASSGRQIRTIRCRAETMSQTWYLTANGEIRNEDDCLDYPGTFVTTYGCHGQKGNQEWEYTRGNEIRLASTQLCLTLSAIELEVTMAPCSKAASQEWVWHRRHHPSTTTVKIIQQLAEEYDE